ncbi:MAG: carbon-nitrogen hydrolase/amidohydrolase [Bacteroidales bacterium]|jgi:predicted amidohydrolase
MADVLRISMIQAPVLWENREGNLERFAGLLRRMKGKTDLAVLPETFSTGFSMRTEALGDDAADGITVAAVKAWAKEYQIAVAGSFIAKEGGKYYNRAFLAAPEGGCRFYDKRHLFRMAGEDSRFTAGEKLAIVAYKGWNICLQVCYDLRFPVWSRNVNNGYDLLIYVANWPETRAGVWKALLPARAIENQAFVCGVNRTGTDGAGLRYAGGSALYSPKGEKLADAGKRETVVRSYTLSKDDLIRLRTKFPVWKDADKFAVIP